MPSGGFVANGRLPRRCQARWPSNLARWTARIESGRARWRPPRSCGRKVLQGGWRLDRARPARAGRLTRHAATALGVVNASSVAPSHGCGGHSSVIILSAPRSQLPRGIRPGRGAAGRVRAGPRCRARVAAKELSRPSGPTQRRQTLIEGDLDPVGWLRGRQTIRCSFYWGRFLLQNHYPQKHRSPFLAAFRTANPTPYLRWIRAKAQPPRPPTPRQRARWKAVQRAKRRGLSLRAIARELGISRITVRKYVEASSPPVYPDRELAAHS